MKAFTIFFLIFFSSFLAAQNCPPGSYWDGAQCVTCPAGSFCPGDDQAHFCPPGSFSSSTGQIACESCPVGTSNPQSGQAFCAACPPGFFSSSTGQIACESCPAGTFNPTSGQAECLACPPGSNSPPGSISCSTLDADCDGVPDEDDLCPGGDDSVDNNNDGQPDCAFPPSFSQIIAAWKCGNNNNKVYVCHIPPGNPANSHTLCISYNALAAHLAHGDFLGSCGNATCASNLIVPNDDGLAEDYNEVEKQSYGIDYQPREAASGNDLHEDFRVFPNPASGQIWISLETAAGRQADVQVINSLGFVVTRQHFETLPEGAVALQLANLRDGLYWLSVRVEGKAARSAKFVLLNSARQTD